jgi:hypothetical protein
MQQLQIEQARIEAQKQIAAMQVGATAAAAKDKLDKQMQLEGTKLGVDISKHKAQINQQRQQSFMQSAKNKPRGE